MRGDEIWSATVFVVYRFLTVENIFFFQRRNSKLITNEKYSRQINIPSLANLYSTQKLENITSLIPKELLGKVGPSYINLVSDVSV